MAYEYECEEVIKNVIKELIYFKKGKNELAEKEIDEIYAKAKAFDEIREFITRKSKEEEEKRPRTLLSDYDYGLYQAYDNVDDIIQEHLEDE